jgi:hypothetical protein
MSVGNKFNHLKLSLKLRSVSLRFLEIDLLILVAYELNSYSQKQKNRFFS